MAHEAVNVVGLDLLGGHCVRVTFDDGVRRDRDLRPLLTGPVFERIRTDAAEFEKLAIDAELGVLCWPNGADLDAELLRYDDLWNEVVGVARTA